MSIIDLSGNGIVSTVGDVPPPGYDNEFADDVAAALNANDPELVAAMAAYSGGIGGDTTVANITDATPEAKAFLLAVSAAARQVAAGFGTAALQADTVFAQTIHVHSASQITSGVFDAARIPPSSAITNVVPAGGTIASLTAPEQALITQGCFVTIATGAIYAYSGTGSKTSTASYVLTGLTQIDWVNVVNKPSTFAPSAHATSHGSAGSDPITLDNLAGTLGITKGGTGQTGASGAINALLPAQAGNANRVLGTNGAVAAWVAQTGGGGSSTPNYKSVGGVVSVAVTTSEVVIGSATTALVGSGASAVVYIAAFISLQKGTGTTATTWTVRIRRGTTTAGTLIATATGTSAVANDAVPIPVGGFDALGAASGQYVVTVQGSAANGTSRYYSLNAFEIGSGSGGSGSISSARDFGAVGGGTTNDTVALQAFLDAVKVSGRGDIPAGTYLVTPNSLLLQPSSDAHMAGPVITTAGDATILKVDAANQANGPLLRIWNYDQSDTAGTFIQGGYLGGMKFVDLTGATAAERCGLSLRGVDGMIFGRMIGETLRSNVIKLPSYTVSSNPDPYHIANCRFDGVVGLDCVGVAFNGDNGIGYNGCEIGYITSTKQAGSIVGGAYRAGGPSNQIFFISGGSCDGWLVEQYSSGSTVSHLRIGAIENDACEKGVTLQRVSDVKIGRHRNIHRYIAGIDSYWPITSLELGAVGVPVISASVDWFENRIESGGGLDDVGALIKSYDGNQTGIYIRGTINDNAALGVGATQLLANIDDNTVISVTLDADEIYNSFSSKPTALATATTSTTIATGGYPRTLIFPSEQWDTGADYDASTGKFTIPTKGWYLAGVAVTLSASANTQVRLGIAFDRGGQFYAKETYGYSDGQGAQTFECAAMREFEAGDAVYPIIGHNSGITQALVDGLSIHSANQFCVRAL